MNLPPPPAAHQRFNLRGELTRAYSAPRSLQAPRTLFGRVPRAALSPRSSPSAPPRSRSPRPRAPQRLHDEHVAIVELALDVTQTRLAFRAHLVDVPLDLLDHRVVFVERLLCCARRSLERRNARSVLPSHSKSVCEGGKRTYACVCAWMAGAPDPRCCAALDERGENGGEVERNTGLSKVKEEVKEAEKNIARGRTDTAD